MADSIRPGLSKDVRDDLKVLIANSRDQSEFPYIYGYVTKVAEPCDISPGYCHGIVMHQIVRNLFVFALVSAMLQSGMAQWTPHFGADAAHDKDLSLSHSSLSHENHAHSNKPDAGAIEAPPGEAQERRCVRPSIDCDCPDCLGYFDAHFHALPTIDIVPMEVSGPGAHESSMIASLASVNLTPPAPPPRL